MKSKTSVCLMGGKKWHASTPQTSPCFCRLQSGGLHHSQRAVEVGKADDFRAGDVWAVALALGRVEQGAFLSLIHI